MIRAHRVNATAQDDATPISGWNISPNVAYTMVILPGSMSCGVLLWSEDGVLVATGAALVGAEQSCVLTPQSGQTVEMVDAELGWHLRLTTTGTESQREIRILPSVDLPDEIHPIYADDDLALARATAAIDEAAHYPDDVAVSCPLGLGAGIRAIVSVPVDGVPVVGQVESITWTATPDGTTEQVVVRRHFAIAPEPYVEPVPVVPPVVVDDAGTTDAVTATSGNVLDNDEAGLTVVAANGLSASVGVAVDGSNGGTFTIASDGAWTFDPDGGFATLEGSETADTSVTYHASDGVSEASATLTITVSAVTGATLWTPAQITGAIVFDSLDSENITLSGSAVTAWADMLGSGITAAQGTAAAQPAMGTDEIVFAADYLTIASSNSAAWAKALHSTGGHIFSLVKFGAVANPNTFYGLCGTTAGTASNVGTSIFFDDRSSLPRNNALAILTFRGVHNTWAIDAVSDNSIPVNEYCIVSVALDPDNVVAAQRSIAQINEGSALAANAKTSTPSTANSTYNMQIGAVGSNAAPLVGAMRVIAFLPPIDDADRLRMAGWAAHRHGMTDLLPSDHPYKSAPPTI